MDKNSPNDSSKDQVRIKPRDQESWMKFLKDQINKQKDQEWFTKESWMKFSKESSNNKTKE